MSPEKFWKSCTPAFLLTGGYSAVALWYGITLQTTLGIPVGLMGAYVGATDIETWIPDCKTPPPPGRENTNGQKPSQYHNGKVAPICPYAMRGAIWYQGESNTAKTEIPKYAGKMRDLLNGWKRVFENPRFKLYFCQLCPWGNPLVPLMQEAKALRYLHSSPWRGYLMNEAGLPLGAFHIGALDGEEAAWQNPSADIMKPIADY